MRQFLIEFLKQLEVAIPPASGGHHAITFAQYGSDESGWDDRLALQVNQGGLLSCLFLDEEDFAGGPEALVAAVVAIVRAPVKQA